MKYEVIGWTSFEDNDSINYPKEIGYAERNAIIDEIRKHKFKFSGDSHLERENCIPVLNDGRKRCIFEDDWNELMAEAYNHYGNYIHNKRLEYEDEICPNSSHIFREENFVPKIIENEHFDIEVNEEIFNMAKKFNPFYLEYNYNLRYLDEDDTITLHYYNESLTFLVKSVNKCRTEIRFSKNKIINSKVQLNIIHKPMESKKKFQKLSILVTEDNAYELLQNCLKSYDFNTVLNLFEHYKVEDFIIDNEEEFAKLIKTFVSDLIEYSFDYKFILMFFDYIDDFDLHKKLAYMVKDEDPKVLIDFLNKYLDEKEIEDCILENIDFIKEKAFHCENLIFKAVELKSDDLEIRKKLYYEYENNYSGILLMFGGELYDDLLGKDEFYLKIDKYKKLSCYEIRAILQALYYTNYEKVKYEPKYLYEGAIKYKEYIYSKIDLDNCLEEILLYAIDDGVSRIEKTVNGSEIISMLIYSLDVFTGFKYKLIEKTALKYSEKYPELIIKLNSRYK